MVDSPTRRSPVAPGRLARRAPAAASRPMSANVDARTCTATIATAAPVERYGLRPDGSRGPWVEVLDVAGADLSRLKGAPVLLDHMPVTSAQVGVVENAIITNSEAVATLRFGEAPRAAELFDDIVAGVRRQVSVGYDPIAAKLIEAGEVPTFAVTPRFLEVSIVAIAADPAATFRSHPGVPSMTTPAANAADPAAAAAAATASERERVATIMDLAARGGHAPSWVRSMIESGTTIEAARVASLELLHARTEAAPISGTTSVFGGYDATEPTARREAMAQAVVARRRPDLARIERNSRAATYAAMTDDQLIAELTGDRRATLRSAVLGSPSVRAHTTSDFPLLLEDIGSKALLDAYELAPPNYRVIAAERSFADFRAHSFLRPGDFPVPVLNPEAVEITLGTLGETKESVSAFRYARRLGLSREILVNDGLGALADLAGMAGRRVADLENSLVYAQLALNSGSGPTLRDGSAMATTVRGNKASSGAAIDAAAIALARVAMRGVTSVDGLKLNVMPKFLVCGPAKEHQALQVVAAATMPAQDSNTNPYKGTMDVIADANISGNNWYLFADPRVVPTLIWGYLEMYRGPQFEIQDSWAIDGIEARVLLYFGTGAVDWRGIYHNPGA